MGLEYCEDCDRLIDLDYDADHLHFYKLKGGEDEIKN